MQKNTEKQFVTLRSSVEVLQTSTAIHTLRPLQTLHPLHISIESDVPIYSVAANLMQYLEPDFPKKNWTDLLPYEVKGSNQSELVCAAVSPDDAINQFMNAFPDEEFYSIQCRQPEKELQRFRCGQWVATSAGETVMVLRSRLLKVEDGVDGSTKLRRIERHYETNLELNGWLPESELMEGIAA